MSVPKWWNPKLPPGIEVQLTEAEFREIKREINSKHLAGKVSTRCSTGQLWEGEYGEVTFHAWAPGDLPFIARSIAKVLAQRPALAGALEVQG